jgi:hypothetical protein
MIYSTRLIASVNRFYMKKVLLALFLIFTLFPLSTSFSQKVDTPQTLGIVLTSNAPFNYKDADGTTVVLGEVSNTKSFPVSGVKVWVGFYDENSDKPLETTIGTTILEVIPPFGKSPYMIKSPSPNSKITNVSVNLLGFSSSPDKKSLLSFALDNLNIGENLSLSGKITNHGKLNSTNTKIYLISYDPFTPPRVLGIATTEIDDVIKVGDSHDFNFNVPRDARATIFKIVAESKDYSSGLVDVTKTTVDFISSLVTINDISVTDSEGNRLPDLVVNSPVNIQSELTIQYSQNQKPEVQPYVYYIQIKQSGEKAFVEYIGKVEGSFNSTGQQFTTVPWTPQQDGLYFIETFVWDPNAIPLASNGPISLVLVN